MKRNFSFLTFTVLISLFAIRPFAFAKEPLFPMGPDTPTKSSCLGEIRRLHTTLVKQVDESYTPTGQSMEDVGMENGAIAAQRIQNLDLLRKVTRKSFKKEKLTDSDLTRMGSLLTSYCMAQRFPNSSAEDDIKDCEEEAARFCATQE